MAALAPMPSASVTMTVSARPGARVKERRANLKSVIRLMARRPPRQSGRPSFHFLVERERPFSTPALSVSMFIFAELKRWRVVSVDGECVGPDDSERQMAFGG